MKIGVIDYKAGNLRNVQKAIEKLGAHSEVISEKVSLTSYDGLILPGVGSYKEGMDKLNEAELSELIYTEVMEMKKPLLGICLGMQLIGESGDEGGMSNGLSLLPMRVVQFKTEICKERIPHMGWNEVQPDNKSILLEGIPSEADFYFAHSYHVECDEDIISGHCDYGYLFAAAVEHQNIFATQFHPEKSQRYGFKVLNNFLDYCKKKTI